MIDRIFARSKYSWRQHDMETIMMTRCGYHEFEKSHQIFDKFLELTDQQDRTDRSYRRYDQQSVRDLLGYARVKSDILKGHDVGLFPTISEDELCMIAWLEIASEFESAIILF